MWHLGRLGVPRGDQPESNPTATFLTRPLTIRVAEPGMYREMSHVRQPGVFGKDASQSNGRPLTAPALGLLVTDATLRGLSAKEAKS